MIIKRLYIKNFRSIEELSIDFSARVNVFVGVNGSGKSTVLDAIRILYSWLAARLRNKKGNGLVIDYRDIKKGSSYCLLRIEVEHEGRTVAWQIYRQNRTYRAKPAAKSDFLQLTKFADSIIQSHPEENFGMVSEPANGSDNTWPLMSFYSVIRSIVSPPVRVRKRHKMSALDLYDKDSLDSGANFNAFFYWYREKEDLENQYIRDDRNYRDSQLECVRRSVASVFEHYSNFRVNRSPMGFVVDKGNEHFSISQLSDGEKCYLTLVMDIARTLAVCGENMQDPLQTQNVVLIDELDLHLHPQWQMSVLDKLRTAFPLCQFVITTHSPYILSSVNTASDSSANTVSDKMFVLTNGVVEEKSINPYGRSVDQLLPEVFSMPTLRNPDVTKLIDDVWSHIQRGDTESQEFNASYKRLQTLIPDDIELVKMRMDLSRRQHASYN